MTYKKPNLSVNYISQHLIVVEEWRERKHPWLITTPNRKAPRVMNKDVPFLSHVPYNDSWGMPMYAKPPKKMLIINIMDILRRYTDTAHRLSQKEIVEILENEYQMVVDRKAVKRNLMNLLSLGTTLSISESARLNKNGEEETLYTDWYLERDFSRCGIAFAG
jgi:hypothetical protein